MRAETFDPFNFLEAADDQLRNEEGCSITEAMCRVSDVARQLAKAARDARYRQLKRQGVAVRRSMLSNQYEPYQGYGIPGRGTRDVFYVRIYGEL
jgi:hypothetical protein